MVQPLPTLGKRSVDELRLRGRAREAVQDGSILGFGARELVLDQTQNHAVGNELPLVIVLLGFYTEGRAFLHGGADQIAGRDLGKPEALGEDLTLCPLPRARRPQDEDVH